MKRFSGRRALLGLLSLGVIVSSSLLYLHSVKADSLPNTQTPPGFALTQVAGGLTAPTVAKFAPDGRIFVAEKGGAVKIIQNGQVLPTPFYTIPNVNNYVDRGLLGMALDPNFATNGYVYLLYTYDNNPSDVAGPKTGRLIRVTAAGNTAVAGSEVVILGKNAGNSVQTSCYDFPSTSDCLPADGLSHAPGSVEFGPDKKLYVTVGDAAGYDDIDPKALNAQNLNYLAGKVLRINPDGSAPADNPFYTGDPAANTSKIFAYGVRNAFRLTVRPSDGLIMVGDVGWNTWEEVNVVTNGANLGWPCYEAREQQNGTGAPGIGAYKDLAACQQMYANPPSNLTWPVKYYPHPPSSAVVSGVFYDGTNYPAEYKGRFFYGDYAKNQMYMLQLDGTNAMVPNSDQTFASNAGGPVNFFTGPGGDIYYVSILKGGIYHIEYSTDNRAPIAIASSNVTFGPAPLAVNFSANGSSDPEGDKLSYSWDFGDGSPAASGLAPAHTFTKDGTYTVTLTVTDIYNHATTKTLKIYAGLTAPDVQISAPADFTVADPEQIINFAGSATDGRDGVLPATALTWQVIIHHCPLDSCHIHNVESITGAGGSFAFPHHDGPFYIEVALTATNSAGLSTTKYVNVYPTGQPITHAIQFDGINGYAQAVGSQDFRLQTFTVEAMVKTLTTDDWGGEVISLGNNWTVRVMPNGQVLFSFWSANGWQDTVANTNVKDGLWHHVAVTKTATGIKILVDGAVLAQNENSTPIVYAYGGNLVVGRHGDGDDHFSFNGAIDEIRIWSAPRSDAAIQQYRGTTLPAGQANLTAYYKIDAGSGNTVADNSAAASHPLTLFGGVTWTAGMPLSDPVVTVPTTPITDIKDNFNAAAVDTGIWNATAGTGQLQQNQTLSISPTAGQPGYFGLASKQQYELKDNAVYVEVPQTTSRSTTAETQLIAELDSANNITIGTTGNSLHARLRVNGVNNDNFMPYDAVAMRWWRIREAGGTIYLETSPDATNWTARRQFAKPFALDKLKVIVQAGTWQAVAAPGTAKFDNLNTPAPANNALSFDGTANGSAKISGAAARLYTYQTFSLETWVKAQATGVWGGEVVSNGNNYGVRILPDGNVRFYIHVGNLVWKNYETTGLNLKDGTWHHIAVTKGGGTANIYIDGVLKKSFASPEQIVYALGNDFVAGRHGDGDDHFNLTGQIDELRIWNTQRTAAEISASYKTAGLAATAGLIGSWQFNGAGAAVYADSIGGNNFVPGTGVALSGGAPL